MDATAWVPLIGAVIAVSGVIFTQVRADQRAAAERREGWERERQRWAREDASRIYEHRREAYMGFLSMHVAHLFGKDKWEAWKGDEPIPEDALDDMVRQLDLVRVYGTPAAGEAADALHDWLRTLYYGPIGADARGHAGRGRALFDAYLERIRCDLGVPDAGAVGGDEGRGPADGRGVSGAHGTGSSHGDSPAGPSVRST